MLRKRFAAIALASGFILAGCENLPNTATLFGAPKVGACPDYRTGSAPFEPPFPVACEGMRQIPGGVMYIPLNDVAPSKQRPGPNDTVVIHYEAFLASSGQRVDSSYERGESSVLSVAELIDGWGQAIQLMNKGEEWLVFVPSELAYGDEPLGDLIPANSDMVYRMKLEGFLSEAEMLAIAQGPATPPSPEDKTVTAPQQTVKMPLGPDMAAWEAAFPWDLEAPGVNVLKSGVSYKLLERGNSSSRNATVTDTVVIHYEGRLAETSEFFDSSWSRGEPAVFPAGGLIPGFTEILTYMRPGDRVIAHIPSDQAYGEAGSEGAIPPNADLMFQVVMLGHQPQD